MLDEEAASAMQTLLPWQGVALVGYEGTKWRSERNAHAHLKLARCDVWSDHSTETGLWRGGWGDVQRSIQVRGVAVRESGAHVRPYGLASDRIRAAERWNVPKHRLMIAKSRGERRS